MVFDGIIVFILNKYKKIKINKKWKNMNSIKVKFFVILNKYIGGYVLFN